MIVTLNGTFEIANGVSRVARILGKEIAGMTQRTPTDEPLRSSWVKAFPNRAVREMNLSYEVAWPVCATQAEALAQSRSVMAQCPKGGVLTEQLGAQLTTWEQAWVTGITPTRLGVSTVFTFQLRATNPATAELSPLATMDTRYLANLSAITHLTGGDEATDLDAQITADVPVGFAALMWVELGELVQQLTMRLISDPDPGETETNTDPEAGPLIVVPLDYDADTNAKIWVQ